jgi:pimeloyl-ACP methyl ester carboxylesterase
VTGNKGSVLGREGTLKKARTHGEPPIEVVVIHGGPGAAGEMAPVATEIARHRGVLEPLQTAPSLSGQVAELEPVIEDHADPPVILIGFSWGAWLSLILAARHPSLVRKVILIGCGPLEAEYAAGIEATRVNRLSEDERLELRAVMEAIENPASHDRGAALARMGDLFSTADAYDPLPGAHDDVDFRPDIYEAVWKEGAALRRSGGLLALAGRIACPVVAFHGDYDPHPAEGVEKPLADALADFRLVPIENCGHKPWIERQARDKFYHLLMEEVSSGSP